MKRSATHSDAPRSRYLDEYSFATGHDVFGGKPPEDTIKRQVVDSGRRDQRRGALRAFFPVFLVIGSALIFIPRLLAADAPGQVTQQDLQGAFEDAQRAWGVKIPDLVKIEFVPLNNCSLGGIVPRTPHVSEVQRYDMMQTEPGIRRDFASREHSVAHYWVIRINSSCDWRHLDLDGSMQHEVGHILIGTDFHSKDRNSVMYWVVRGDRKQRITPEDRELAKGFTQEAW
jgi:hypothetical protein